MIIMKKLMLTIWVAMLTSNLFAQQADAVYVVFTGTNNNTAGFNHHIHQNYNQSLYRYPTRIFTIFDRQKDYFFKFTFMNWNDEPDEPIISKPVSFLNTVSYIDWDVVAPTLTKNGAEALYQQIISKSEIYFIDRNEIQNGTMKVIPVGVLMDRF